MLAIYVSCCARSTRGDGGAGISHVRRRRGVAGDAEPSRSEGTVSTKVVILTTLVDPFSNTR
jgi:hypothetical protein